MRFAYPEDELRPLSCRPLTRDQANPGHIELNDPLGNYSLTLVDSLSTLAILASSEGPPSRRKRALLQFQKAVSAVVELYGDGSDGPRGQGKRARGFDLDSKVQVFETVIRGVGGLLSAHLFATGELPISGYDPKRARGKDGIKWSRKFTYDGQLLRLAHDLGSRLLPAFSTKTGIPYPRVNLRYGVPFYKNSPLRGTCYEDENLRNRCPPVGQNDRELTETCSAGAGSLVLELAVLSRLTGDPQFEDLAKRAFWAIWTRRSSIDLIGSGIDAETGQWVGSSTGLGAGIDSFFEYAVKSYILFSGVEDPAHGFMDANTAGVEYDDLTLMRDDHSSEAFLEVWKVAHSAIKRHIYRGSTYVHPHYIQGDMWTGAARAFWMDSLSAFFQGLLVLTGEIEEATETHLVFTALWSRYSAIPERWSTATGGIEHGLTWWGGRPEFIESTYYLYRATKDPWYLHVGEMVMRDIKRRSWTKCGLAGIQDVRSGQLSDRMESFFLGETAKYLHLLFDPNHPLNKLDAPFVFTTEGHPLIIPRSPSDAISQKRPSHNIEPRGREDMCPTAPEPVAFSVSHVAARQDLFHAANMVRLHHMPTRDTTDSPLQEFSSDHPSITLADVRSPSNFTYYPWTLPPELVPKQAVSRPIAASPTFDITFPAVPSVVLTMPILQRVRSGILINSVGGLKLGMIQDVAMSGSSPRGDGDLYRVSMINNMPMGKDERVYMNREAVTSVVSPQDPNFTQVKDAVMLSLVLDVDSAPNAQQEESTSGPINSSTPTNASLQEGVTELLRAAESDSALQQLLAFFSTHVTPSLADPPSAPDPQYLRSQHAAVIAFGVGAAPIPDLPETASHDLAGKPQGPLLWTRIARAGDGCSPLPPELPRENQVLVLRRGKCSFSDKMNNIPSFAPSGNSLQLVVVVSGFEDSGMSEEERSLERGGYLVRPLLDRAQSSPSGMVRRNPIPMIMVGGGEDVWATFGRIKGAGIKRRYEIRAQGIKISNLVIL